MLNDYLSLFEEKQVKESVEDIIVFSQLCGYLCKTFSYRQINNKSKQEYSVRFYKNEIKRTILTMDLVFYKKEKIMKMYVYCYLFTESFLLNLKQTHSCLLIDVDDGFFSIDLYKTKTKDILDLLSTTKSFL